MTIALQRVVTAFAGYVIILRGNVFTVGDRIMMSGVRGDVVALGFMQTTVMEMGQTPSEQHDDPSMWIRGRQYSGRIVRVTNDKIFDTPVYNYTRDFPYIWEELTLLVRYADDYKIVERPSVEPRVYRRLTDNWVELSVRHIARIAEARALKDAMSREILAALNKAGIGVASSTYAVVEMPPIEVRTVN